jgi:hypothetical protein
MGVFLYEAILPDIIVMYIDLLLDNPSLAFYFYLDE